MSTKSASFPKPTESAPWYRIPQRQAVMVEHPCLVKNVDKAIETLGGDKAIKTFLRQDHAEKPINLKFHPEDQFSQSILSVNCQTNNVLLKVTVPKRTGRKRKRGTDDPFVEDLQEPPPKRSARYLLRSLRDNEGFYQIEPIASIPTVHIFRTMPDYAYSTAQSRFLTQVREKVLPFEYPLLNGFHLNPGRGLEDTEIIPPPILSTIAYPSNYAYRQNPAIKAFIDPTTGSRCLFNTQAPARIFTQQCQWDHPASEIPSTISPSAPPLESEPHNFRGLVTILRTIFARRPIWTRRGLANQLPPNAPIFLCKYAIGYAAYAMRSGPWRDTYIRLGVDPRSDPSFRKYQTLMLQLVSAKKSSAENKRYEDHSLRAWRRDPDKESHIFTGTGRVPLDGKCWQLCDLQDPILARLVDFPDLHIRSQCEARYFGWYQNGTWCKLKIILKAKIDLMLDGVTLDEEFDQKFDRLLDLPESYNVPAIPPEEATRQQSTTEEDSRIRREATSSWRSAGREGDPLLGFLPRNASKLELEWAAQYRALCRAPQGKLPHSGRLSKSKLNVRGSFIREEDDDGDGDVDDDGGARTGRELDGMTQVPGENELDLLGEELELEDEEEDQWELEVADEIENDDNGEFQDVSTPAP